VITGASSGIGNALAFELAARGYTLGLASRRSSRLQDIRDALLAKHPGVKVELAALDVDQVDTVQASLDDLFTRMGGADIVVVNAGVNRFTRVGRSQLVGVSSLAAENAIPRQAAYCASKAALSMYLDIARIELSRKGIGVTTILPGFVTPRSHVRRIRSPCSRHSLEVARADHALWFGDLVLHGKARRLSPLQGDSLPFRPSEPYDRTPAEEGDGR
jgi:short-subunit dehydrogenase